VLRNIEDEDSVIKLINHSNYNELKENGAISAGMIPKIDNAFDSLEKGVKNVYITHFSSIKERKFESGEGTVINY
jgi:acetylglutamate kinase